VQLHQILALARKWFWFLLLASFLGGIAGLAVDHFLLKVYDAQATLFVGSPNHSDINSLTGDQQAAKALALFPQSDSVLLATLQSVGDKSLSLAQLTTKVSVDNDQNSQFVIIHVRDGDPRRAARLATEIARQSLAEFETTVNDSNRAQFLQQEISKLQIQISSLEAQLAIAERTSSTDPTQAARASQLNTQLSTLQQLYGQLISSYTSLTIVQVQLLHEAEIPKKPAGLGTPLALAIGMLAGLVAAAGLILFFEQIDDIMRTPAKITQVTGLLTLITVRYMKGIEATNQASLLNGHYEDASNVAKRQLLLARERQPSVHQFNGVGNPVRLIPAIAKRVWHYQTNAVSDTSKSALLSDRQALSNQGAGEGVTIELMPGTVKQASVALSNSEIKRDLLTPTLKAFLDDERSQHPSNGFFQLPSAFLTLGVLLSGERSQWVSDGKSFGSLLITSPEDGDGKTLIASWVALGLARTGVEVVLVDANLHKPEIHTLFGLSNRVGLSTLLTNDQMADTPNIALQQTSEPNLVILSGGPTINALPRELSSLRMATIMNKLSKKAYVVIDSPAILTSGESIALADKSDGVLIVVDARNTSAAKLEQSVGSLTWVNANILGVVLNQVDDQD